MILEMFFGTALGIMLDYNKSSSTLPMNGWQKPCSNDWFMFGLHKGVLVIHSLKRLFMMSRGLNKDLTQVVAILKPGDVRMVCDGHKSFW